MLPQCYPSATGATPALPSDFPLQYYPGTTLVLPQSCPNSLHALAANAWQGRIYDETNGEIKLRPKTPCVP